MTVVLYFRFWVGKDRICQPLELYSSSTSRNSIFYHRRQSSAYVSEDNSHSNGAYMQANVTVSGDTQVPI
jgi:hypothetical protein